MALEVEGVVGGGVHRDEALGGSRRLEPLHLALSSAERLVGDLGPVVLVNPLFMVGAQADLLEGSPVRAQLVGRHPGRSEAVLSEQLTDELPAAALFRRLWIRTSSTSPSSSTARHRYIRLPLIRTTISSRCQRELGLHRSCRKFRAITGPNLPTQRRIVS